MRLLYLSRLQNVAKQESIALYTFRLFKEMLDVDPTLSIVWTVPRGTTEDQAAWIVDGLGADRVKVWGCAPRKGPRRIGSFTTEELYFEFGQYLSKHLYDVVLTNQPATLPLYRTVMTNHMQQERYAVTTPFVAQQMWTATAEAERQSPGFYAGAKDVASEALGAMFADVNLWESDHLFSAWQKTMTEWVKPSLLAAVVDSSQVVPMGFPQGRLTEIADARRGANGVVMWGARLSGSKLPHRTFNELDSCKLPVIVTSPDSIDESFGKTWPVFQFRQADHDLFVETMAEASAFLCLSKTESYGIGWLEMLGSGMLGVFSDEQWVQETLPDWYPFVSDDRQERRRMLHAAATQDLADFRARTVEWVRKTHDVRLSGVRTAGLLNDLHEEAVEADAALRKNPFVLQADEVCRDGMTIEGVIDAVAAVNDGVSRGEAGDPVSRMFIRRGLQTLGWEDIGTVTESAFVRR